MELLSGECHRISLTDEKSILFQIMAQCHQATTITSADVSQDLCSLTASPGHSELTNSKYIDVVTHNCHDVMEFTYKRKHIM